MANEAAWRSEADTRAALLEIWAAMQACVARGIAQNGILPGGLSVHRRAPALHAKLSARDDGVITSYSIHYTKLYEEQIAAAVSGVHVVKAFNTLFAQVLSSGA